MNIWSIDKGWNAVNLSTDIKVNSSYNTTFIFDGDNQILSGYLNGESFGSVTTGSILGQHPANIGLGAVNNDSYFHDGAYGGSSGYNFKGYIGEFAMYDKALDESERQTIESYISNKWFKGIENQGTVNNDIITGSEFDDKLSGDSGDDVLFGGLGADILNGGQGNDSFDFSSLEDSSINASDLIEDFEQGNDKIDLSAISEELSFTDFEITVENGYTTIKDKNSDFAIDLQGDIALGEDDFIF